jgi:secondary thiamine-phosphate synthase enzyme
VRQTLAPLKASQTTLTVTTDERIEIINLTEQIQSLPGVREITQGFILVHSLHTTTGLCINEFQEALLHDIKALLQRLAPADLIYRHNDPAYSDCTRQNATSHLGAITLGQSVYVPIEQGRLVLGTWQRILFCELDGPQARRLHTQLIGV